MHVVSHPEADQELEAAALWYDERQADLGSDFVDEFESTLRRIMAEPERWRSGEQWGQTLTYDNWRDSRQSGGMARRLRIHVSDGWYCAMSRANGGGVAGVVLEGEEEAWPRVHRRRR
jgi:hypothetical protein